MRRLWNLKLLKRYIFLLVHQTHEKSKSGTACLHTNYSNKQWEPLCIQLLYNRLICLWWQTREWLTDFQEKQTQSPNRVRWLQLQGHEDRNQFVEPWQSLSISNKRMRWQLWIGIDNWEWCSMRSLIRGLLGRIVALSCLFLASFLHRAMPWKKRNFCEKLVKKYIYIVRVSMVQFGFVRICLKFGGKHFVHFVFDFVFLGFWFICCIIYSKILYGLVLKPKSMKTLRNFMLNFAIYDSRKYSKIYI